MEKEGLKYNHNLKTHVIYYETMDIIVSKLQQIPHLDKLRGNNEILLLICRLIENYIPRNDKKCPVDKMKLAIEIYTTIFGAITEQETASKILYIQLLHDNKKIRRGSFFKIFVFYSKSYLKKKFILD